MNFHCVFNELLFQPFNRKWWHDKRVALTHCRNAGQMHSTAYRWSFANQTEQKKKQSIIIWNANIIIINQFCIIAQSVGLMRNKAKTLLIHSGDGNIGPRTIYCDEAVKLMYRAALHNWCQTNTYESYNELNYAIKNNIQRLFIHRFYSSTESI